MQKEIHKSVEFPVTVALKAGARGSAQGLCQHGTPQGHWELGRITATFFKNKAYNRRTLLSGTNKIGNKNDC